MWTVADPERDPDARRVRARRHPAARARRPAARGRDDGRAHGRRSATSAATSCPPPARRAASTLPTAELDPRLNLQTGTVALPGGVADGLTYEVTLGRRPGRHRGRSCAAATITPVDRTEELELLPPPVRNLAADLVEGHDRGWEQMAAIRDEFVDDGFYDATAGHAARALLRPHRQRCSRIPTAIVGFEEQYAAAAAVMAQVAELPVRVVVGYEIPADVVAERAGRGHGRRHLGVGRARRRRARLGPRRRHARPLAHARPRDAGRDDRADRHPQPAAAAAAAAAGRAAAPGGRGGRRARIEPGPPPLRRRAGLGAVGRRRGRRGRRADRCCSLLFAAVVVGWKVLRRHRRRRPAVDDRAHRRGVGRGDRPLHRGRRAAPDATTTPHETVGVYAGGTQRARPTSSPTCAGSPARSTGRRTPPAARPTSTPPRRGGAATRSPPSCAAHGGSAQRLRMQPRPAPAAPRPARRPAPARRRVGQR